MNAAGNPAPQRTSRFPWWAFLIAAVVALVGLPCLGLAGSYLYLDVRGRGTWTHWQSLGTPPEPAVEIAPSDPNTVYVRTTSGKIYACSHGLSEASNGWTEMSALPDPAPYADYKNHYYQGEVEPPPGEVIAESFVTVWLAEQAYETRYALLSDGSVWAWSYGGGSYTAIGTLLVGLLGGIVLGAAAAVVLVVVGVVRRARSRQMGS